MKLLYFHQHFSTPKGGTGTRSYEFAKELIAQGHQVTIVCGSFDVANTGLTGSFIHGRREGDVDGIHIVEFELMYSNNQSFLTRSKQFMRFAMLCCREIKSANPDLVFCTSTPLTIAFPGMYAKVIKRIPFVFEVRDLWPELPKAMGVIKQPIILWLLKLLEIAAYKSADKVIALSNGMAEGVANHVSYQNIVTISNGCDLYLSQCEDAGTELPNLQEYFEQGSFFAVYAGTHGLANGLDVLVDAAVQLKEMQFEHIKIVLVGDGMKKRSLIEQANALQLDNIIFLENMPKQALFSLYKKCDVGLMVLENIPAFYNGTSPNKFFDYLSARLPVICNYPGWIKAEIESTNIGLSVAPESPKEIAKALNKLSQDKVLLSNMSRNCEQLAHDKFNRRNLAEKFIKTLEEVHSNANK